MGICQYRAKLRKGEGVTTIPRGSTLTVKVRRWKCHTPYGEEIVYSPNKYRETEGIKDVNDPTAITWGYFSPDESKLYVTGEYGAVGMTNDVLAEKIIALGLAKEHIVADSAEPKSIAELRRLGVQRLTASVKGADSVKNGIDRMQRCDIVIDERCTQTIEEFENYTWQKDRSTGEYINQPIDAYNHHIDSIRYGLQAVQNKHGKPEERISIFNRG